MTGPGHVVRVVCRPLLLPGFHLSGLEPVSAADAGQAQDALRRLGSDPTTAMILVDEGLYRALGAEVRHRLERQERPLVAPFPLPLWRAGAAAEEAVLEILRQAIGYRVRPR